ncbi:MAG: preprotein translocase subunit SecE [Schwartzia sp.]|nr:preprotein translocase subunit SecE [Schwartzia sp. (in: firmicutes)]MBR1885353.1 preprotein translocase subunit SecE [Schwartzia sp. (in: firmicutes)]
MKVLAEEKASAVSSESGFNLIKFLGEVKAEMGKVSWTTKQDLLTDTAVVAVAVVIVCALIWVCDTFFSRLFTLILR